MKGHEAEWALDIARNALNEHDPHSDLPTPKLRQAFLLHANLLKDRDNL
jgi:hypothetical protein